MGVSARRAIACVATVTAASALAACGSGPPARGVSLRSRGSSASTSGSRVRSASGAASVVTVWTWQPGLRKAAKAFNASHPGIRVVVDDLPGGYNGLYPKLYAAVRAHRPPDVAEIGYRTLPSFEAIGAVQNLASDIPKTVRNEFLPAFLSQVTVGSGLYGLPMGYGPMVLIYRSDIFKRYGLSIPTTWSQFASDAEVLRTKAPSVSMADFNNTQLPAAMAWEAGVSWFGVRHGKWIVDMTSPKSIMVASYLQNLVAKHLVNGVTSVTAQDKALATGTVAAVVDGSWETGLIARTAPSTAGKWDVAPPPRWDPKVKTNGDLGGVAFSVLKGAPNQKAAVEFVRWLLTSHTSWRYIINGANVLPASRSAYPVVPTVGNQFYQGEKLYPLFEKLGAEIPAHWVWPPNMNVFETTETNLMNEVFSGKLTFPEAFHKLQADEIAALRHAGYSVTS